MSPLPPSSPQVVSFGGGWSRPYTRDMGRARGGLQQAGSRQRHPAVSDGSDGSSFGVIHEEYPRSYQAGHQFFSRCILDVGVEELAPWNAKTGRTSSEDATQALLADVGSMVVPSSGVATCIPPNGPLHALIIEHVPAWDKARKHNGGAADNKYGDHLGVGIYVYDQERDTWYKRVLHGRSTCGAVRFPLKRMKTAVTKRCQLQSSIETGEFSVAANVSDGYPQRFTNADGALRGVREKRIEDRALDRDRLMAERERLMAEHARRRLANISPDQLLSIRT